MGLFLTVNKKAMSIKNQLLIGFILLLGGFVKAQIPQSISIEKGTNGQRTQLACVPGQENFAGTVSLGTVSAQSNDIDLDTMFLCVNDTVGIVHNGDQVLTGDPVPATPAGVCYGFYNCAPSISGPDDIAVIGADPCLVPDPLPLPGSPLDFLVIIENDNLNGDITLFNDGNLIDNFNGGNPFQVFWSPLTFDELNDLGGGIFKPNYEDNGPCAHTNIDAAFSVVYLNEIEVQNLQIGPLVNLGDCSARFDLLGGLPEFNASETYTITASLASNPAVLATINTGPTGHGEEVKISVPQAGIYNVTVEDTKGCPLTFQIDMSACTQTVTLTVDDISIEPSVSTICIPILTEDFIEILNFQFVVSYDPTVLNVASPGIVNPNPILGVSPPFGATAPEGNYIVAWTALPPIGVDIPNGEVLFELCFDVVGSLGDQTTINIIETSTLPLDFNNNNGDVIAAIVNPGNLIIEPNTVFDLVITASDETCADLENGSLTAQASGGSAPYTYTCVSDDGSINTTVTIVDPTDAFTLNNLAPDIYTITVTDDTGAALPAESIAINPGIDIEVIIGASPAECFGGEGEMTATAIVNTVIIDPPLPEYQFEWSTGDFGNVLSNITAGSYSVTLTDTNLMCSGTSTDNLPQAAPIVFTTESITNASCSGIADGALEVDISGGTGSTYNLILQDINGNTLSTITDTVISVNNLSDGDYLLIAEDGNLCSDSTIINIGASISLELNVSAAQEVNCFGDCDAFLTVDAQTIGGTSSIYNFAWTPAVNNLDGAATTTASDLCAGTYTLQLTDDVGCSTSSTFDISEPTELAASVIDVQNESCAVGNDGSITLEVNGGTPTYTYDWGPLGQTDSIAINLSEGLYTVTVTDDNNCEVILNQDIIAPTPPTINSMPDFALACNGDSDGTLTVDAVGSVNPISLYNWSTGNSGISLTTETNLSAGVYYVTIEDAIGCIAIDSAEVTEPDALEIANFVSNSPLCPGEDNGSIQVQITGGSGFYDIVWSNGNTDAVNIGLAAGDYSVTITDQINNCPAITGTATIVDPAGINALIFDIAPVSCAGAIGIDCDGSASAAAEYTDGTVGSFTFNWLPSGEITSNATTSSANFLCAGMDSLIVSDGFCKDTFFFEVGAPEPLASDIAINDATCLGLDDGTATAQGLGGTSPYTYLWEGNIAGPTLNGLSAGSYQVTIEDDKGCTITSVAFVDEPDFPLGGSVDLNASSPEVSCFGESDAFVSVIAIGGNVSQGNLQYIWGPGVSASISSSSAFGLSSGTYAVTVIDNQGCQFPLTFDIGSPDPITFNIPEIDDILCPGGTTTVTVDSAVGGNGLSSLFYTFAIDGGAPQTLGTSIEVFPGQHIVTVTDISDDACSSDTTFSIAGLTESVLNYPNPIEIELGASQQVLPSIAAFNNPLDPDSIFWTPNDFLTFSDDLLEPTVTPLESMEYLIEAYDINGCYISAELIIEVDKNRNIYIPNIFTPNGDGFNSIFQPIAGVGVRKMNYFRVYDRWGAMLHERLEVNGNDLSFENPAVAWDGKFKGKEVNQGVYIYLAEIEFLDGRVLLYRGDVTLVK